MLPKSYLKVIAASVVYESTLSKKAKIQALRFIETEASVEQLAELLSEGMLKSAMLFVASRSYARIAYDKYFSQSAKVCAGRENKPLCMKEFKIKANMARIAALRREMSKCGQTDNAKKCRNMFIKHINKIEKQIQKDRVK